MPQVVYLGDVSGEVELLAALGNGTLDAVARGEVGNGEAARASGDRFVVAAVDSLAEYGGIALNASRHGDAGLHRREARLADGRAPDRLRGVASRPRRVPRAGGFVEPGVRK